jgi:virginiamycin B lyase
VTVTLAGQSSPLATANLGAGAPGCAVVAGGVTCSVSVTAPAGSNTFVITTYNGTNGSGQQLSTARIAATVTQNTTTQVALTLNGVVATTQVILGTTTAPVGSPLSIAVTVNAYDQNGNLIVGSGNFSSPITLTLADPSGATALSTTSVAAPGTSVTLNYSGNSMGTATITPSNAAPNGAATFTATGNVVTTYTVPNTDTGYPNVIAPGPTGDRAIWYGGSGVIGRMSTTGQTTEYSSGNDIYTLAPGADGNMWFGDSSGQIGSVTAGGTVTFVSPSNYNNGCGTQLCYIANFMVSGPDGNVWFSDDAGYIGRVTTTGLVQEWYIPNLTGWPGGGSEPNEIAFIGNTLYAADLYGYVDAIPISGTGASSAPTGSVVQVADAGPGCTQVWGVAAGPDGNVWFSDNCRNVGLIPPGSFNAGSLLEWSAAGILNDGYFGLLAASPQGIFAIDEDTSVVYRIFPSANLIPSANSPGTYVPAITTINAFGYAWDYIYSLCLGPDGNIWAMEQEQAPISIAKVITGGATSGALSAGRLSTTLSRHAFATKARHAQSYRRINR